MEPKDGAAGDSCRVFMVVSRLRINGTTLESGCVTCLCPSGWLMHSLSALGAISSFLWLMQLCLSFEYKITSYAIGVIRAVEAYLWCSCGLAWGLPKIEGKTNNNV